MSASARPALILRRGDIVDLMSPADYLAAVEAVFRCHADGDTDVPAPMHIAAAHGTFHAKGARIDLDRPYVAVKLNGNFPSNPAATGLPTIQGVVLLCDGADGTVLAVMDSIEITLRRTAAATALAARYLARRDVECIAICGCGEQGRAQLIALADVMTPRRALVWDADANRAQTFAREMRDAVPFAVIAVDALREATLPSAVIVTATTACVPFLTRDAVAPGTFIAAVGADNPDKSELAPDLLAHATVVVDSLAQAAVMGDLHHAIAAGRMTAAGVHAELGDLVAGRKHGRSREDEITIFDSTGVALEDVASAVWIYRRAVERGAGFSLSLGAADASLN